MCPQSPVVEGAMAFEGAEKRLELDFSLPAGSAADAPGASPARAGAADGAGGGAGAVQRSSER